MSQLSSLKKIPSPTESHGFASGPQARVARMTEYDYLVSSDLRRLLKPMHDSSTVVLIHALLSGVTAATLGNMKPYICVSIHFFAPQSSVQWIWLCDWRRFPASIQATANVECCHMTSILNFLNRTTREYSLLLQFTLYHHGTPSSFLLSNQALPYQLGPFLLPGINQAMTANIRKQRKHAIAKADEELLAELGYKQEFRRGFKPIEVFLLSLVTRTTPTSFRFLESRSASLVSFLLLRQSWCSSSASILTDYPTTVLSCSIRYQMVVLLPWSGGSVSLRLLSKPPNLLKGFSSGPSPVSSSLSSACRWQNLLRPLLHQGGYVVNFDSLSSASH